MAWKCSEIDTDYEASNCSPQDCGSYNNGYCGCKPDPDNENECLSCDAVEVEVIAVKTLKEIWGAIGESETALAVAARQIGDRPNSKRIIGDALMRIREL